MNEFSCARNDPKSKRKQTRNRTEFRRKRGTKKKRRKKQGST